MRAELTKRLDVKRPLFGPGGHDRNTAPEYFGLMGVAHGPLRRRHSGRGRAVPERPPVDPGRSSFRCDFMGRSDHMSGVEKGSIACSAPRHSARIVYTTWEWVMSLGFA